MTEKTTPITTTRTLNEFWFGFHYTDLLSNLVYFKRTGTKFLGMLYVHVFHVIFVAKGDREFAMYINPLGW